MLYFQVLTQMYDCMFSLALKKRPHFIPLLSIVALFLFIGYMFLAHGAPSELSLVETEMKIFAVGILLDLTFNFLFVLGLRRKLKFLVVLMRILLGAYGIGLLWISYLFIDDVLYDELSEASANYQDMFEMIAFLVIMTSHGVSEWWLITRRAKNLDATYSEEDVDLEVLDNSW